MANKFSALIVDDNTINRRIHNVLLSKFGFKTSVAEDRQKVVDLYHAGEYFDLVLMELDMHIMNGLQATQVLRDMGVNSMIVGVTSHGLDAELQAFMGVGLNDYFKKPLKADTIASLLQKLINNN